MLGLFLKINKNVISFVQSMAKLCVFLYDLYEKHAYCVRLTACCVTIKQLTCICFESARFYNMDYMSRSIVMRTCLSSDKIQFVSPL